MLNQCLYDFVTGNQLIYNRNIELYARFIQNFENKCKNKPCARYNCNNKPRQLPYCNSFEEVLKMRKAQQIYANPNHQAHNHPYNSI